MLTIVNDLRISLSRQLLVQRRECASGNGGTYQCYHDLEEWPVKSSADSTGRIRRDPELIQ